MVNAVSTTVCRMIIRCHCSKVGMQETSVERFGWGQRTGWADVFKVAPESTSNHYMAFNISTNMPWVQGVRWRCLQAEMRFDKWARRFSRILWRNVERPSLWECIGGSECNKEELRLDSDYFAWWKCCLVPSPCVCSHWSRSLCCSSQAELAPSKSVSVNLRACRTLMDIEKGLNNRLELYWSPY